MKHANIKIKGMHCQSCEMLLTDVLAELPGVKAAQVSLKQEAANVEYDEKKTSEKEMRSAIEAEGYKTV
jgi:copper chaperone CopZ